MLRFALIHAIQIVGEAASRVSNETRDRFPQIPWADIVGMRHRLVHGYFDIDRKILWATATLAMPELRSELCRILDLDG